MQSAKGFWWESLTSDVSTVICWKYCIDVYSFFKKKYYLTSIPMIHLFFLFLVVQNEKKFQKTWNMNHFPPTSFFSKQHSILLSLRQALDKSWIKALCNIVIPLLFHLKGIRILLLLIVDQHLSIFITEIIKL